MPVPRGRLRNAPAVQLQPQDKNAFLMLYYCGGLMSEKQLQGYCYRSKHEKNASSRLLALFDNRYLNRNNDPQRWASFPQLVYWLAQRGYDVVYGMLAEHDIDISPNTRNPYVSSWKPITLTHHLQVNDIFLKVLNDLESSSELHIGRWEGETFFRSKQWKRPQYVGGTVRFPDKSGKLVTKVVEPDGFFAIQRWLDKKKQRLQVHGFTLEVDRATEQQKPSKKKKVSIDEKLRQGAALVDSQAYQKAFRLKTGRCLMVTTSWQRAENMMQLAEDAGVSWAWYFTTFETATSPDNNFLTDAIWRKADGSQTVALITS